MASTLLIVEDDPFVRRYYQRLFSLRDYDVDMAGNGEEGFSKAKATKPSLIIVDIMMPKLDGLGLIDLLKKDPETKDIPIVVLSNLEDRETMEAAKSKGVNEYIPKSDVEPEQLLSKLEKYINHQN